MNKLREFIDEVRLRFAFIVADWRASRSMPVAAKQEIITPFNAWRMAINTAARHIDPFLCYDVTDDIPEAVQFMLFEAGKSPEEAIYATMTPYNLGAYEGARLDGHGRRGGVGAVSAKQLSGWSDVQMPIIDMAQGVHRRLTEQAATQVGDRALRVAQESILTKNMPLAIGLHVRVKSKTGKHATITKVITSEVDQRPMYEVVFDHNKEVAHARAIDLYWPGRKSIKGAK